MLDKLRQMQKQLDKSMEDMTAKNFAARLRDLAQAESGIKGVLGKLLPKTIGARFAELADHLKRAIGEQAEANTGVRKESKAIMEELVGFFTRTRIEKYDKVHKAMKEADTLAGLDKLSGTILENQTAAAVEQSELWAKRFSTWAEMLDPPKQDGGGGGGGGGGEMSAEQMELLLKLFRIVQGEAELRGRTRSLDERRAEDKEYGPKAAKLHSNQLTLHDALNEVIEKVQDPRAMQLLGQAEKAMLDAAALLDKPQTDAPTVAAENEVIELLLAGTNQAASSMGQGMAGLSQMLQQMLGMGMGSGAGKKGGGSTAGGSTDKANELTADSKKGDRGDQKSGNAASGHSLSKVPAEYRDVLQAYFSGLDALQAKD